MKRGSEMEGRVDEGTRRAIRLPPGAVVPQARDPRQTFWRALTARNSAIEPSATRMFSAELAYENRR